MFEFLRKYQLSKATEALEVAEKELAALKLLLKQIEGSSYYIDKWIAAEKLVTKLQYKVRTLTK